MKLSELIVPELVTVPFQAADKWQALAALAQLPLRAQRYPERLAQAIEQALVQRERSVTTGVGDGIAIPHAAVDGIEELIAVLAISPEGIPFDALDRRPAHIVVGLIIPRHKKFMHIKTLAEIARLLSRVEVRQRLCACRTPAEVVQALTDLEGNGARGTPGAKPG